VRDWLKQGEGVLDTEKLPLTEMLRLALGLEVLLNRCQCQLRNCYRSQCCAGSLCQ
jgi:hypothetical protein